MKDESKFVSSNLIEVIRSFPIIREVEHCNSTFAVSPFDIQSICPFCKATIKLRASSALYEIEDLFDAVSIWLINPEAQKIFEKRQKEIIEDIDED